MSIRKEKKTANPEIMSRADIAREFNRSLPWVDKAWKTQKNGSKGIIPPPIHAGAPIWIRSAVYAWIEKLQQEAIEAAENQGHAV